MRSPTLKHSKNEWRNYRGGALVEFAIVLPLLLILVFGIIEFGLLLYNQAVITNASREGARAGIYYYTEAPHYLDDEEIATIAENYCKDNLISFGSDEPTAEAEQGSVTGDELKVTVEYVYEFLVTSILIENLPGVDEFGKIKLQAKTVMLLE